MKLQHGLIVVAALVLTACGGNGKPAPEATASAAPSSAPPTSASVSPSPSPTSATTPPAVPAKGDIPSRDFVIGKWGTDGDCTLAIDLRPDGTSDGPFGNWTYKDGVISFADAPDFHVSVTVIDGKTMQSIGNTAKPATMTRCP
jgi:hypothetical protein